MNATLTENAGPADNAVSPWHAGEIKLQRAVGVAERMQEVGQRVIRRFMPDQHRAFFSQLPFVALGAVDHDGDVWATLVAGAPGFRWCNAKLRAPWHRQLQPGNEPLLH